ncbi:MAG: prephenate dehydratase [Pseudomonadales bacterium]|nr:prephenate dehydratase [Pseudomonadales bacterium]MDP6472055.1 prephenate dehydratase [Pseudomonadales bacterium]MDP6826672.1 prephenate dehydratase [Pseudomonadales bacterium]MDP6969967.1 prephenate dehydratase [Pseudomonadales bacterium]
MTREDTALEPIRTRIDAIDEELQKLLNERASLALDVGKIKQATPGDEVPVFYRPEREAQILTRLKERNAGPLSDNDMAHLFREIISCCLNLEQPLTIAYLGPSGTYTEAAAIKQFGHFASMRSLTAIDEVFREVESDNAHYGVVPVENSTEGMVNHTLDCFIGCSPDLRICAEVELAIHHAFLLNVHHEGEIREIVSHSQSLAQCRRWLDANYPGVSRRDCASNSEAAREAAADPAIAAVAGATAAERHGLRVAAANIEDQAYNKTRFLVVGKQYVGHSGRDKTSLLVSTRNEPGALFRVLGPFHKHEISLTRIETRPARSGDWSYVFFIDFHGHQGDESVGKVLEEIGEVALEVRTLGSYPQAVI